jgi:hypothetical protein
MTQKWKERGKNRTLSAINKHSRQARAYQGTTLRSPFFFLLLDSF